MRYNLSLLLLLNLLGGVLVANADDSVTITTYYPAPYGVYKEFETYSNTYLAHTSGNVGIGTKSPLAKLDLRGRIKIVDGTEGNSKVLTSDASGLSRWETPSGAPASTGLYGYCQEWAFGTVLAPAYIDPGPPISCQCPAGYQIITLDQGSSSPIFPRIRSCYKQ